MWKSKDGIPTWRKTDRMERWITDSSVIEKATPNHPTVFRRPLIIAHYFQQAFQSVKFLPSCTSDLLLLTTVHVYTYLLSNVRGQLTDICQVLPYMWTVNNRCRLCMYYKCDFTCTYWILDFYTGYIFCIYTCASIILLSYMKQLVDVAEWTSNLGLYTQCCRNTDRVFKKVVSILHFYILIKCI